MTTSLANAPHVAKAIASEETKVFIELPEN
jgi:hypothetical protein